MYAAELFSGACSKTTAHFLSAVQVHSMIT